MGYRNEREDTFIETSAQIARLSGAKALVEQVNLVISKSTERGNALFTSEVVYREFLSTLVRDFISVRNQIAREFLRCKKLRVTLAEVDECMAKMRIFGTQRFNRLFVVKAAIDRRFAGRNFIETDSIIRFLDGAASDLAYRDFFEIALKEEIIKMESISDNIIREIGCLSSAPLVTEKEPSRGCLCSAVGDRAACPGKSTSDVKLPQDNCFDEHAPTTRCLSGTEECEVTHFLGKHRVALEGLIAFAKKSAFSTAFRRKDKNKRSLQLLEDLESWSYSGAAPIVGRRCVYYFTDILIFLECPPSAKILSYDPDFDELGAAIEAADMRLDPKEAEKQVLN